MNFEHACQAIPAGKTWEARSGRHCAACRARWPGCSSGGYRRGDGPGCSIAASPAGPTQETATRSHREPSSLNPRRDASACWPTGGWDQQAVECLECRRSEAPGDACRDRDRQMTGHRAVGVYGKRSCARWAARPSRLASSTARAHPEAARRPWDRGGNISTAATSFARLGDWEDRAATMSP